MAAAVGTRTSQGATGVKWPSPRSTSLADSDVFNKLGKSDQEGVSWNHRGASRSSITGTCRALVQSKRSSGREVLTPFKNTATMEVGLLANHDGAPLRLMLCLAADAAILAIAIAAANQSTDHFGY